MSRSLTTETLLATEAALPKARAERAMEAALPKTGAERVPVTGQQNPPPDPFLDPEPPRRYSPGYAGRREASEGAGRAGGGRRPVRRTRLS